MYFVHKSLYCRNHDDIVYVVMRGAGKHSNLQGQWNQSRTYLEGAVVWMMGMMKLRCVNHVAGLGILAPGWLRDLAVTRGGDGRVVLYTCGVCGNILFLLLLLHFWLCFLIINLYINPDIAKSTILITQDKKKSSVPCSMYINALFCWQEI